MAIKEVKVLKGVDPAAIPFEELLEGNQPVVLEGVARNWSLVDVASKSSEAAIQHLKSFYNGLTVGVYRADKSIDGRFFYDDTFTRLNFEKLRMPLDEALDLMAACLVDDEQPTVYVGSTSMDVCLPGLSQNNHLPFNHSMFDANAPLVSIWLGTRSVASAHYDAPNNIACVAAGQRKFTLFPPDQIANLYPGPLEPTPGGQAITVVDLENPDLNRYPGFQTALDNAQEAFLDAGDAIFIPSMWWHQVKSLAPFNALINYWWSSVPNYMDSPMNALYYALLAIRDRPVAEKLAWKAVFDYYVFGDATKAREHLPRDAWGLLGPVDELNARKLRAMLLGKLNR